MRTWSLTVQRGGNLALVAPHGTQPIAGVTPEVAALLREIRPGTVLDCVGSAGNIRNVVVDRIVGPQHVLEALLPKLPDAWVHEIGALSALRAAQRVAKGHDATADLLAAMEQHEPGIEAIVAMLDEAARAPLLDDYARWAEGQPATAEVLRFVPIEAWTDAQISAAIEEMLATGVFGEVSATSLLAAAKRAKGPKIGKLAKKLGAAQKDAAKGDSIDVAWVRIETGLSNARIVGGTKDVVYVAGEEPGEDLGWVGARRATSAPTPVLIAFDRTGAELSETRGAEVPKTTSDPSQGMHDEAEAKILVGGAVDTFRPPPWRFGEWEGVDEQGYRLRWLKKQLCIASPGHPYIAMTFSDVPVSVQLAPPWLGIELREGHFLALALDALMGEHEVRVCSKLVLERGKKIVRPVPPPKAIALFDTLVAHGMIAALNPLARDELLLSVLDRMSRVSKSTAARLLVAADSPRIVWHDAHWFTASDGIVERFDAALDGEPVRFACKRVKRDVAEISIQAPSGRRTVTIAPFVWEVAQLVDAELKQHGAKQRVYALDTFQEDIGVFAVLTPAERRALVAAGVVGIGESATR